MKLEARDYEKENLDLKEVECCICGDKIEIDNSFSDGINNFCDLCVHPETWGENENKL